MLRDTTPLSTEVKANVFNMSAEEKARRETCLKYKDFYYDRAQEHLTLLNQDVDPVTVNLLAPIIKKKVSLLYKRQLTREFVGKSSSVSFLESLYTKIRIDNILRNVDLAAELTGTGLVFVGIDESGETYLRVYDGSDFSAIGKDEDQEMLDAISLVSVKTILQKKGKVQDAKRILESQIWTEDTITTYKDGQRVTSKPNDYKTLPFAIFKGEDIYGSLLGHAPSASIVNLNSIINIGLTHIGYMIKMQSGSPIALEGFERGEGLVVHPGQAINLPIGAKATVLDLNPKIEASLAYINHIEDKLYETSGIPKVSIVGDSDSTSGKQLIIKWSPLVDVFKDKSNRYEKYELDLANKILEINDLPLLDEVKVYYPKESLLPLSDDLADIELKLKLGLITPIDVLIQENPTLTEAEAEALILENLEFNKSITGKDSQKDERDAQNGGLDANR